MCALFVSRTGTLHAGSDAARASLAAGSSSSSSAEARAMAALSAEARAIPLRSEARANSARKG